MLQVVEYVGCAIVGCCGNDDNDRNGINDCEDNGDGDDGDNANGDGDDNANSLREVSALVQT